MNTKLSSSQIASGTVKALASDGTGVVREAGQKVKFVPFVLVGEDAEFEIVESRAKFERTRLLTLRKTSSDRIEPLCLHFGYKTSTAPCGSCQLQHAKPELQQELKHNWLIETCTRIGKWEPTHLQNLLDVLQVVALKPYGYRHRARFHLGPVTQESKASAQIRRNFGYHADCAQNSLVDLKECHIVVSEIQKLIQPVREVVTKRLQEKRFDHQSFQVELTRHIDPKNKQTHVSLAIFHEGRKRQEIDTKLLKLCLQDLMPFGVKNPDEEDLLLIQPEAHQSSQNQLRHTASFYVHRVGFLQPHCQAATVYRSIVGDMIRNSGLSQTASSAASDRKFTVWDLYAGCGLFTDSVFEAGFQPKSTQVVHVELSEESVLAAKKQFAGANFEILYEAAAVGSFLRGRAKQKPHLLPQLVIADPPRSGMGLEDARLLAELAVRSKAQLILICCDPASFARDTAVFLAAGYQIKSAFLVDAFPQTRHYECLVHLG